ncbi:hypothetical protein D3C87_2182910 [compost metagenome]
MRGDDQDHTDHRLEEARRRCQRIFAGGEAQSVDIGIKNIDGRGVDVVLHVDDLV